MNIMFSNPRSTIQTVDTRKNGMVNMFTMSRIARPITQIPKPPTVETIKEVQEYPTKKKMKWGEPVWFFFHTIAEKIKPEHFSTVRLGLFQIITNICRNLPCPTCSQHATTYLASINMNNIQTKEQLIDLFYIFHNELNKRKGFAQFPRELLHEKYSKANTANIINYFLLHFLDKSYSIRMIADDFHRKRLIGEIKKWLNENLHHFNL